MWFPFLLKQVTLWPGFTFLQPQLHSHLHVMECVYVLALQSSQCFPLLFCFSLTNPPITQTQLKNHPVLTHIHWIALFDVFLRLNPAVDIQSARLVFANEMESSTLLQINNSASIGFHFTSQNGRNHIFIRHNYTALPKLRQSFYPPRNISQRKQIVSAGYCFFRIMVSNFAKIVSPTRQHYLVL